MHTCIEACQGESAQVDERDRAWALKVLVLATRPAPGALAFTDIVHVGDGEALRSYPGTAYRAVPPGGLPTHWPDVANALGGSGFEICT